MRNLKPMLAVDVKDKSKISYPVLASPKLDGVRATIQNGVVLSRSLKPIRNKHVQKLFGKMEYEGYDGELIVGKVNDPHVYNHTVSGVMSEDGTPEVRFYVFDILSEGTYEERVESIKPTPNGPICWVGYSTISNEDELNRYERDCLLDNFEGIMIRSPKGIYKHGRSTLREGYLLKVKQFKDIEATIVGCEVLYHNENDPKINELGRTERSSHKEGKVASDMLGAFVCKADGFTDTFKVGTGYTHEMRKDLWKNKETLLGKMIKIKYQPAGVLDSPRFPVFIGFRDKDDT